MDLGVFMMPLHPPEKNRTDCFEEDIDLVVRADGLGFKEAWIGQHHSVAWEPIPANDVFIANVLPRTKNIRLGTGVSILPQHHPVNVAVRLAYLDHLSRGRINAGFGQGGVQTDWGLFELPDPATQGLMTVESIDMILKLWQTDPPFDFKGDHWHIKIENTIPEQGIGTILQPYQKPHPPVGMSIVRPDSKAATMAGQRGYHPISTNLAPDCDLPQHWATYCAGAESANRPEPDRSNWRISRSVLVAESNDQALDYLMNSAVARSYEYLITLLTGAKMLWIPKRDLDMPDAEVTPEYMIEELFIYGDVKTVTEKLHNLWDVTGGFGTLLMIAHDWDNRDLWEKSMDLLAKEVAPALPTI